MDRGSLFYRSRKYPPFSQKTLIFNNVDFYRTAMNEDLISNDEF